LILFGLTTAVVAGAIRVARTGDGLPVDSRMAPRAVDEGTTASIPDTGASDVGQRLGAYRAEVLRVIDGDTLEARVMIWLDQAVTTRVRLRDVDAPELNGSCMGERAAADAARTALAALVGVRPVILTDIGRDKYGGRIVARVSTMDGVDAGRTLVSAGHARNAGRGRRERWC
jgi:endonuclease YncB( thermonuclease family)